MNEAIKEFQSAMQSHGIPITKKFFADGRLHRCSCGCKSKGRKKNAWYVFYPDGLPAGVFGCWKCGIHQTWHANLGRELSPAERKDLKEKTEAMRRVREAEDAKNKADASKKATAIWKGASPANQDHPYLVKKGIQPHGVREYKGRLVVPLRNTKGELQSLQFISADGDKKFLRGGGVSGGYFGIGKPEGVLCLAEGFATGASIRAATGYAVAIAFNAHNLEPVACALHEKFPDIQLIICADDDVLTPGNPGLTKARAAAKAIDGVAAIPDFGPDRPNGSTDFNDLHRLRGLDAVRKCIESARSIPNDNMNGAVMICLADVKPEPIDWLWKGRIARGKVTLISGDPGIGKSLMTIDVAARVSCGLLWPVDNSPCPVGDVILLSAEDDAADTIRPRLDAAGANVQRVHLVKAIRETRGKNNIISRMFSLRKDLDKLSATLAGLPQCVLVVIDPISAYLDGTDSHNNADVRSLLAPLGDLAVKHRIAVVCVTHLNKSGNGNAIYRTMDSLAFVAAVRSVMMVTKDTDDPERRLVLPVKNNLATDTLGLAYRVATVGDAPVVEWESEPVRITADEALSSAREDDRSERDEAGGWLRDLLINGAISANEVKRQAAQAGFSWATVRRAKHELGIKPTKSGFAEGWVWTLPSKMPNEAEDAHPNNVSSFDDGEHLRDGSSGGWEAEV